MEEVKTIDCLTAESVSILTQRFTEINGAKERIGENNRRAYVNCEEGRTSLAENEPTDVVSAVLSMWGEPPTVIEETDNQEEV